MTFPKIGTRILLSLIMFFCAIWLTGSMDARAETDIQPMSGSKSWINPAYRDLVSRLPKPVPRPIKPFGNENDIPVAGSIQETAQLLHDEMTARKTEFSFIMRFEFDFDDVEILLDEAYYTGVATDDYLYYNNLSWGAKWTGYPGDVTVEFSAQYHTTAEQEASIDEWVSTNINTIIACAYDPEDKEKKIHDWIVSNIAYDTDYGDQSYSAYGAIFNRKAVCQGYSLLGYKLLMTVGIPARIIDSEDMNHAWNMVNLCGHWYHLDMTWDDPIPDEPGRILYDFYNLSDTEISEADPPHYNWITSAPAAPDSYTEGVCSGYIKSGDMNADGSITIADAIIALQASCNLDFACPLPADADTDADNRIGIRDVLYILSLCTQAR